METRVADGTAGRLRLESRRLEEIVAPARPLLRPVPRSAMFFPLVVVAAVLPGLYALNWWDLNPPGPWWGLRGLAVLDGYVLDQTPYPGAGQPAEVDAFREVALQPPLYAWLEALCLKLSFGRNLLATVLPSYAAGALVVILVYLHGRLWRTRGIGLTAAVLTAFNRELLVQMQQASPATLGLAAILAALLCYGQHQVAADEARRRLWVVLAGLALGLAVLAVGLFALAVVPIVLLDLAVRAVEPAPRRPDRWWRAALTGLGLGAGTLTMALSVLAAGPWLVQMFTRHGGEFLAALAAPGPALGDSAAGGLVATLLALAPATLPLSLLGLVRGVRQVLAAEPDDPTALGLTFWLVWLAVAALVPALWPAAPLAARRLLLLVPLNLLAAQAMADLAARRVAARNLIWLAPLTALSVSWWFSADLRDAVGGLQQAGQRYDALGLLKLHLGLDLLVVLAVATRRLDRWARRRDHRRRLVLGGFLLAVMMVTAGVGLREVRFRHSETRDVLDLRDAIARRHRARPFQVLAVVGPPPVTVGPLRPPGRLRFMLRATLPALAPLELTRIEDLPAAPDLQRLVILVGTDRRLSYPVQSQLGLEALHSSPSGMLDAFATTYNPPRPARKGRR
jgi:4-amino-4-deoxy-L-arabinose transferase-like glycosyltransferase